MSLTSHSRVGKIHVAPCSCELHVRIRELEAELAEEKVTIGLLRGDLRDAKEREQTIHGQFMHAKARAEKAEARVAELEAHLEADCDAPSEREAD